MPTCYSRLWWAKRQFAVVVRVAQFNANEVAEYLPYMARKYELPIELVEMQCKLLPFRRHPLEGYLSRLSQAIADLKDRDPEDAHVLALARLLALPIWSNDRDLSGRDVKCYTTARLLRLLSEESKISG